MECVCRSDWYFDNLSGSHHQSQVRHGLRSGSRNVNSPTQRLKTKGMREGIDSGLPRANFPRKISKEDLRTTAVSQNK